MLEIANQFQLTTQRLWQRLGLDLRGLDEAREISLIVDERKLRLGESETGRHLVVTGQAGHLAEDSWLRAQQINRILKVNLGMMLASRAVASLVPESPTATAVIVQGAYPYEARSDELLDRIVEDSIQMIEMHSAELSPPASPSQVVDSSKVAPGTIIYRL